MFCDIFCLKINAKTFRSKSMYEGSIIILILSRINPIHRIDRHFFKIYSHTVLPYTPRTSQRSFPVSLPVKILKQLLPSSILAKGPAHLILFNLITLVILGECYKTRCSSCDTLTWHQIYCVFTYIYSLLIEKDLCDCQNISVKLL